MPRTIATASNVFAACDRLDATNERWNREDVRTEVGGGGWVVIDPLIKAWRALRPLREVAPSTPTELLQQVAASLEAHIAGFTREAEGRLTECQKIFDATIAELSEKLVSLEIELEEKTENLASSESENAALTEQLEQAKAELETSRTENARLETQSDALTGQVSRMGVLGIFRPKTTRIAESPAIRGLPGGITFPEPVNIPRLCASVPPDPVVFHSFRRYRYPSS